MKPPRLARCSHSGV